MRLKLQMIGVFAVPFIFIGAIRGLIKGLTLRCNTNWFIKFMEGTLFEIIC